MEFLNLSIGEFVALASVISAAVLALYLMDRSKRRLTSAAAIFTNQATLGAPTTTAGLGA